MTTPHHYPATLPPVRVAAIEDAARRVRDELTQAHIAAAEYQRQSEQMSASLIAERTAHDLLLSGYKQAVGDVAAAHEKLRIAERMAMYLGWAFEQNLIRPLETTELLEQVLREWKAGISDADLL